MEQQTVYISTKSLIKVVFLAVFLFLVFQIRDILLIFFTALIFAIAFDRPIDRLCEKGVPRILSALVVYFIIFSIFGALLYLVLPPLAVEIKNFALDYSIHLGRLFQPDGEIPFHIGEETLNLRELFNQLSETLAESAKAIVGTLFSIFGGVFSFLAIVFFALFLNTQEKGVKKFVFYLTPDKNKEYVLGLFDKVQQKVGNWIWGRVASSILVGLSAFVGLSLLGIPYALTLGILALLLNFVVFIGPTIASIPAILLGFLVSPFHALAVTILYLIINNALETFIFIPLFMKKAINMNPALLLLVLLIGARLAGVLGVIVAIPTAAIISILMDEYVAKRRRQAEKHLKLI